MNSHCNWLIYSATVEIDWFTWHRPTGHGWFNGEYWVVLAITHQLSQEDLENNYDNLEYNPVSTILNWNKVLAEIWDQSFKRQSFPLKIVVFLDLKYSI
jgi:hypothetical protein